MSHTAEGIVPNRILMGDDADNDTIERKQKTMPESSSLLEAALPSRDIVPLKSRLLRICLWYRIYSTSVG